MSGSCGGGEPTEAGGRLRTLAHLRVLEVLRASGSGLTDEELVEQSGRDREEADGPRDLGRGPWMA